MPCGELEVLRREAADLRQQLKDKQAVAVLKATKDVGTFVRRQSDYEPFLKRRIASNAAAIQQHIARHGCE